MNSIIDSWLSDVRARPAIRFPRAIVADGERTAHLGPRKEFAKVRIGFEPADSFECSTGGVSGDADSVAFAEAALLGALDVLITSAPYPILKVRVVIEKIEADPIDSSEQAFRLAGRDAARKALGGDFSGSTVIGRSA
jgi:hypothetical protein